MRPALAEKRKVKQSDVMVKHSAGGAVPPAGWNPSPFRSADGSCRCRRGARQLLLVLGLVLSGALVNPLQAQDSPAPPATPGETGTEKLSQPPAELTPEELAAWQDRRAAAVALNFSRMLVISSLPARSLQVPKGSTIIEYWCPNCRNCWQITASPCSKSALLRPNP